MSNSVQTGPHGTGSFRLVLVPLGILCPRFHRLHKKYTEIFQHPLDISSPVLYNARYLSTPEDQTHRVLSGLGRLVTFSVRLRSQPRNPCLAILIPLESLWTPAHSVETFNQDEEAGIRKST